MQNLHNSYRHLVGRIWNLDVDIGRNGFVPNKSALHVLRLVYGLEEISNAYIPASYA